MPREERVRPPLLRPLHVRPLQFSYNFSVKFSQRTSNPLTSRKEKPVEAGESEGEQKSKGRVSKAEFEVVYAIGKGGFGKVWKVAQRKGRGVLAMKEMFKAKIIQKKSIASVMNERHLLARVQHPFLINMSFAFQDREKLYLVMDYLDGGDLRYHIGKRRKFTES